MGTLSYVWKRTGSTSTGSNSPTHILVAEDIGCTISVTVTAANCTGSVTSNSSATITKAQQIAPSAPTLADKTATTITLNTVSGCEYNINGGTYLNSPVFTGLSSNTAYTFTQRKAETATHFASPASIAAQFSTQPLGIEENLLGNITLYPNPTSGELKVVCGNLRIEKMEIFDTFGRNIKIIRSENSGSETVINVSHLSAGVYFLKINTEVGQIVKKVLKE